MKLNAFAFFHDRFDELETDLQILSTQTDYEQAVRLVCTISGKLETLDNLLTAISTGNDNGSMLDEICSGLYGVKAHSYRILSRIADSNGKFEKAAELRVKADGFEKAA